MANDFKDNALDIWLHKYFNILKIQVYFFQ